MDKKAFDIYEKILKIDKDNIPALNNIANMFSDAGDYDKAIIMYKRILKQSPNDIVSS